MYGTSIFLYTNSLYGSSLNKYIGWLYSIDFLFKISAIFEIVSSLKTTPVGLFGELTITTLVFSLILFAKSSKSTWKDGWRTKYLSRTFIYLTPYICLFPLTFVYLPPYFETHYIMEHKNQYQGLTKQEVEESGENTVELVGLDVSV